MRSVFPRPPDSATIDALLDREKSLIAQARIVNSFSPKHREEIDAELAEIRRLLEQLGYRHTA